MTQIYNQLKKGRKIAVLIDPEKCQDELQLKQLAEKINFSKIDLVFIGGSTVSELEFNTTIAYLKTYIKLPIVIFPGSPSQISNQANAILLLNLISGRNPDYLIGHHVSAAQKILESQLEVISTSYLLIEGEYKSSVAYVSQTTPIPQNNVSIAYQTALAGKLIGHQAVFLDAGSGAKVSVSEKMVTAIKSLDLPIIVGGGIRSVEQIKKLHQAGANLVVIGNKIEEDVDFLLDIQAYKLSSTKN